MLGEVFLDLAVATKCDPRQRPKHWQQSSWPSDRLCRCASFLASKRFLNNPRPHPHSLQCCSRHYGFLLDTQIGFLYWIHCDVVLMLQAVEALHEQGYAHVDIMWMNNIHIRDWEELSRLHVTVLDLGSSLNHDACLMMKQNPGKHLHVCDLQPWQHLPEPCAHHIGCWTAGAAQPRATCEYASLQLKPLCHRRPECHAAAAHQPCGIATDSMGETTSSTLPSVFNLLLALSLMQVCGCSSQS